MADSAAANQLRTIMQGVLLDKVRADQFPSVTMMNMIESGMDDDMRAEYVQALIEKVNNDPFPSLDMIRRIFALLA